MSHMQLTKPRREAFTATDEQGVPFARILVTLTGGQLSREGHWDHYAYRATVTVAGRRMVVPYSVGTGWSEAPTTLHVLQFIVDDYYSGFDHETFDDFCHEYGYDTDSRTALATYKALQKHVTNVERVFDGIDLGELADIVNASDAADHSSVEAM